MDNVILLQERRAGHPAKSGPAIGQAEIVIFPGVRIERVTDELPQAAPPRRRLPALQNHATAEELE